MTNRIITGLALILLFGSISAQEIVLPELQGYKKITDYPVFVPDNLWDFINGAADTYLAYGFVDLHVAEYKKGKNVIKLEIYRHSNPVMAFGIYSSERSPSFRFMNLGTQGYMVDGAINFFKADYYVKIRTYSKSEKTQQAAESLAVRVAGMLEGEAAMPSLLFQFPGEGKKVNEETYINESVLGHNFLNNAFKATYQVGTDEFSIFLIEFPSGDETKKTVDTYLKAAGQETAGAGTDRIAISDGYNGTIFLAWKEKMLVIFSGLAKDQSSIADRYASEILK